MLQGEKDGTNGGVKGDMLRLCNGAVTTIPKNATRSWLGGHQIKLPIVLSFKVLPKYYDPWRSRRPKATPKSAPSLSFNGAAIPVQVLQSLGGKFNTQYRHKG
jgi:hypothetical protein